MFQINRRRMLSLAGAAAFSPLTLPKAAGASPRVPTTGATVVVSPSLRIYDSRRPDGGGPPKKIKSGETFAIEFGNLLDPYLAGVFINLTVTQTVGAGFLTAQEMSQDPVTTSNINWTSDGQTIANSALVSTGGANAFDVICTGGETHFIIDLQGFVPHLTS
jgi:hypothetical protein